MQQLPMIWHTAVTVVEEGASVEGYNLETTGLDQQITLGEGTQEATVNVTNTYTKQEPLQPQEEAGP